MADAPSESYLDPLAISPQFVDPNAVASKGEDRISLDLLAFINYT